MSTPRKERLVAAVQEDLNKRTKQEWIEGAVALKHERFEVAGALLIAKQIPCYPSRKYKTDWKHICNQRYKRRNR